MILFVVVGVRENKWHVPEILSRIPGASFLLKDRLVTQAQAKWIEIKSSSPSFESLLKFIFNVDRSEPQHLRDYVPYYEKLNRYFPNLTEVYGFLGYCFTYLGEREKALHFFQQAVERKPYFFWFNYDLGILYLEKRDYNRAAVFFQKALETNEDLSVQLMVNSLVYEEIFQWVKGVDTKFLKDRIIETRKEIESILRQMKDLPQSSRQEIKGNWEIRLF